MAFLFEKKNSSTMKKKYKIEALNAAQMWYRR